MKTTPLFFFSDRVPDLHDAPDVGALSSFASLVCCFQQRRIPSAFQSQKTFSPTIVTSLVHRFEESIAGRAYLIEVSAVAKDRWRAYIVRLPGMPTALMPFYGSTPDEAARHLSDWLTRAHQRAATVAGTV
jgi:hypothetical protein